MSPKNAISPFSLTPAPSYSRCTGIFCLSPIHCSVANATCSSMNFSTRLSDHFRSRVSSRAASFMGSCTRTQPCE